jgi:hypothetical protein
VKWIAVAIVIAAAMISLALYLALSPRPRAAAPPPLGDPSKSASAALAAYQPGLRMACWPTDAGELPPSRWSVDLSFDANGQQLARGFSEERGASNPEVTKCVQRLLPPLRIAAPGQTVRVEVPFALP